MIYHLCDERAPSSLILQGRNALWQHLVCMIAALRHLFWARKLFDKKEHTCGTRGCLPLGVEPMVSTAILNTSASLSSSSAGVRDLLVVCAMLPSPAQ
jgi:hypothetical protein